MDTTNMTTGKTDYNAIYWYTAEYSGASTGWVGPFKSEDAACRDAFSRGEVTRIRVIEEA